MSILHFGKNRILSFKYAFSGINQALISEPNLKIHVILALLVVITGLLLHISRVDWMIIILLIGLVISVELTNTAIEVVVDSFTKKEHPGAKLAKDVSSGAVLVVAITAAILGIFIFLPYI